MTISRDPTFEKQATAIAAKDAEIERLREALTTIAGPPERDPDLPPIYQPRWSVEQCRYIARLAREGWTPPVAVDPDLNTARDYAHYLLGTIFEIPSFQRAQDYFLQAIKRGREQGREESAEEIERLRDACKAVIDSKIDLGIAFDKCRAALQPKEGE